MKEKPKRKKTKFDRPYSVSSLDKHIEQILTETASELNLNYETVRKAFMHFLNWNRLNFSQLTYAEYVWPRFGSFFLTDNKKSYKTHVVIDTVIEKHNTKDTLKDCNRVFKQEEINNCLNASDYPDKRKLIDEIMSYHPSIIQLKRRCIKKYTHCAWWIGGKVQEGEWNETTMILQSIEDLSGFLDCLKSMNAEYNFKYKSQQENDVD